MEALTLPLDPNGTDGCVRIKLHTVINMAMDTRHDVAVAKAAFPIGNIPICEEIPRYKKTVEILFSRNR